MRPTRTSRRIVLFLILYLTSCGVAAVFVADGTVHPERRSLTQKDETAMRDVAHQLDSNLEDVSITTPDAITLRAWAIHPHRSNGNASSFCTASAITAPA